MDELHAIPEEQLEIFKEEIRAYIKQMYYFDQGVYKMVKDVPPTNLLKPEYNKLRAEVMDWVISIKKISAFFKLELSRTCLSQQALHDLRGVGVALEVGVQYVYESLRDFNNLDLDDELPKIIAIWPFYFSVVEGVLMRGLNEKEVEKDFVRELDLTRVRDSLNFLSQKEMKSCGIDHK